MASIAEHAQINPLTTAGYHSFLTYKQADALSYIFWDMEEGDGPTSHHGMAETFQDVMEDDIHDGRKLHYLSSTPESWYATLLTLERRGLVQRVYPQGQMRWICTPHGQHVARHYC
jgi:hypothetical protein